VDPFTIGIIGIAVLVFLIALGVPIAYSAASVGLLGLMSLRDPEAMFRMVGGLPLSSAASYTLSVLPLYIVIGFLAFHAGLTKGAFGAAKAWLGRMPGGLATATIFASAGFASVSGSSVASTSVFTQLALPEMEKAGYNQKISAGVVAVGGMLATLIPPSALLVIYAIIVDESVGALLMAGLIPATISIIGYCIVLAVISAVRPDAMPKLPKSSFKEKIYSLKDVWGIVGVVGVIVGGIYFGWMTPTESAAVAVAIIITMAWLKGMKLGDMNNGLVDAVKITSILFIVILSMLIFTRFLAFSGVPAAITEFILALNVEPWVIIVGVIFMYLVLGMMLDGMGMMLLTLPIIHPAVVALGYDPIWFGILVVKLVEIGLVTPPVGLNCFVVHGNRPDIPLSSVFKGVAPFLIVEVFILALILAFPSVVTFLPSIM